MAEESQETKPVEAEAKKDPAGDVLDDPVKVNLEDDKEVMEAALNLVLEALPDESTCPFDGRSFGFEKDGNKALKEHLRRAHPQRVIMWYMFPNLGADAMSIMNKQRNSTGELPPEEEGVQITEDNLNPNFTHVPKSIKSKLIQAGAYGRWVSPQKIRDRLDKGYQFVDRPPEEEGMYQHDHADGKTRSRELVYMAQPGHLRQQTIDLKARLNEERTGNLKSRIEQHSNEMSDVARETYEHHIKRGMVPQNARVLADRADAEGRPLLTKSDPYEFQVNHRRR